MERALSFGSGAADYHRLRPGYPDALVDLVLDHADGPVATALEVGAGTGKATAAFAARGLAVTAIEPDPDMRELLEEQVAREGWAVDVVAASFETFDLASHAPVDLLYAAAAFHWTDPATRWSRAAAALRPGGVLALFGTGVDLVDAGLRSAVDALAATVLPADSWLGWTTEDIEADPLFTDVVGTDIARVAASSADDYVAYLTTVSAYRVLEPIAREGLLGDVRALLPDTVDVTHDVRVHLARRSERGAS